MSIFKKVAAFLFEDQETEIIEEDQLEPLTFENSEIKEDLDEVKQETIKDDEAKEEHPSSKFVDIQDSEHAQQVKAQEQKEKEVVKKEVKREYEFTPVISPMFGVTEEKTKISKKSVSKPMTSHHKNRKNNPLGEILSPYYGFSEDIEEEVVEVASTEPQPTTIETKPSEEAISSVVEEETCDNEPIIEEVHEASVEDTTEIPIIRSPEISAEPAPTVIREEDNEYLVEDAILQEEKEALPLEQLLSDEVRENEDLMQISLFGDSTPIEECTTDHILNK